MKEMIIIKTFELLNYIVDDDIDVNKWAMIATAKDIYRKLGTLDPEINEKEFVEFILAKFEVLSKEYSYNGNNSEIIQYNRKINIMFEISNSIIMFYNLDKFKSSFYFQTEIYFNLVVEYDIYCSLLEKELTLRDEKYTLFSVDSIYKGDDNN